MSSHAEQPAPQGVLADARAGVSAGVAATVPMSAWMWLAQQLGLMGQQPPERVTRWQVRQLHRRQSPRQEDRSSLLEHFTFGAAAGGVFALLRRGLPPRAGAVAGGIAYGLVVWFSAYMGWVPALGILPRADRDRPGRPQAMIAAHVLYGAVLGALLGRRTR